MGRSLLPRLLCSRCPVFNPSLGLHPATLLPTVSKWQNAAAMASWGLAVESAWACRLDGVLNVLLAVAQSPEGAVLVAEQRVFLLLAHCPLLRRVVLPPQEGGQFPAAYMRPTSSDAVAMSTGLAGGAAWRRPLHGSWCRALLLVSTILASAPQLATEAKVFLEVYLPRLRHIFSSGLRSGHVAMLEEATIACRMLALMANRCELAKSVLVNSATQAFVFVTSTCLSERAAPSEVFIPISAIEKLGAWLPTDCEASPAIVPSVFHQRVGYLALEFQRNLLSALLRVASAPNWLNTAGAATGSTAAVAQVAAPGVWPNTQSILGLRQRGPGTGFGVTDVGNSPLRLWAAVMDVTLEGSRRVIEILEVLREALRDQQQASFLLASSGGSTAQVPLSFALAPLEPESKGFETIALSSGLPSPGGLAKGLTPPTSAKFAGLLSPTLSPSTSSKKPKAKESQTEKALYYKHLVLRPDSSVGGQAVPGLVPEAVSLEEIRELCCSILEMSCTLLCHFCQATRSSILAGGERAAPGSSVLHGLLNFLHQVLSGGQLVSLGVRLSTVDYLTELDTMLRCWQNLGVQEGDDRREGDSEGWLGQAAVTD